jgi:hypothetical protein
LQALFPLISPLSFIDWGGAFRPDIIVLIKKKEDIIMMAMVIVGMVGFVGVARFLRTKAGVRALVMGMVLGGFVLFTGRRFAEVNAYAKEYTTEDVMTEIEAIVPGYFDEYRSALADTDASSEASLFSDLAGEIEDFLGSDTGKAVNEMLSDDTFAGIADTSGGFDLSEMIEMVKSLFNLS